MQLLKMATLFVVLAVSACATQHPDQVYWINSLKVDCTGVGPMKCLQVKKSKDMDATTDWQLFYSSIEGFNYEPGYIYQLSIKEESLPPQQVPADGASIKYKLVKVMSKTIDPQFRINDI